VGLDDVPRELLVAIAAVFAMFALVAAIRSWVRGVQRRRRFARGAAGEREAIGLLEAHGFVIEGAQVAGSYELAVDGAPLTAAVRADYVVRVGRLRYVAEVKTGRVAPSLATATTRRQLLEYQHAFGVVGVLLVDADARTVRRVDFGRRAPRPTGIFVVIAALVAGAVGGWVFHAPLDSGRGDVRSLRKKAP
jgi:hypothetical protein